jgi:transcriptional regulator with XRE-family HTH domain
MEADEAQFKLAFATTLVGLRAERAIGSQAQLARLVGVSQTTVQRWEDTQRPHMPNTWELRRLAEVLGVEASELILPRRTQRTRAAIGAAGGSGGTLGDRAKAASLRRARLMAARISDSMSVRMASTPSIRNPPMRWRSRARRAPQDG